MKIEIRNLGVVKQAEIDLRPLTVFVGPNNAGKTWVAYALAGVLGPHGWNQYISAYMDGKVQQTYPPLDNAIQQVFDEGNAQIDMVQFADEYGEMYFNDVARLAKLWMWEFLGTERVTFSDLEMRVRLDETKAHFLKRVQSFWIKAGFSFGRQRQEALLNALKEQDEPTLHFYTTAEGNVLERLSERAVKEFLVANTLASLHQVSFPRVLPFPTERTTLVTFHFSPLAPGVATFQLNSRPRQRRQMKVLAMPVNCFSQLMEDAFNSSLAQRYEHAKVVPEAKEFIQLAQLLESEILGGSVDFSTPEPEPGRELLFQPTKDIKMEMSVVSSMVKELAPLVLYLRYLAAPGELLIIDEPEMNLHPKAQVQLTEFLAMLVNAGLHVLITTHSPYIIDHLVNLLKAAQAEDKQAVQEKFYLKRADAFIPQDQVSVYLFENGTAKNILDKEGFIEWGTFSDVSEQISQLYFEI